MFRLVFSMFYLTLIMFTTLNAHAQEGLMDIPESLMKDIENGNAESAYFIATQFEKKSYDDEKLYPKAKQWMLKAAEMGYPQAMFELALMYEFEEMEAKAFDWLMKASGFGHSEAIHSIGTYYLLGLGQMPVDCVQAYEWFEKAEAKDNIVAYNDHAWALATSADEQCRNPERALRIFSKVKSHYRYNLLEMPLTYLDTQAVIHANISDFNTAIALQQLVVDGLEKESEKRAEFIERLESYKQRKPWVQTIIIQNH